MQQQTSKPIRRSSISKGVSKQENHVGELHELDEKWQESSSGKFAILNFIDKIKKLNVGQNE